MRKGIALAVLAFVLVASWFAYSKHAQARRELSYHRALAPYQRDLALGMDREQVIAYLRSHEAMCATVRYGGGEGDTCEIKIAEEAGGVFCEPWTVYVAFEFTSADKLREIHIRKSATCL